MALIIMAGAVALFITERLPVDLVAVLELLALALNGLVTPSQAVSGISSPAVVPIGGIFILSAGLRRTGVAAFLGRWGERMFVLRLPSGSPLEGRTLEQSRLGFGPRPARRRHPAWQPDPTGPLPLDPAARLGSAPHPGDA